MGLITQDLAVEIQREYYTETLRVTIPCTPTKAQLLVVLAILLERPIRGCQNKVHRFRKELKLCGVF